MARKLSLIVVVFSLAGLSAAASDAATGVRAAKAVEDSAPASSSSSIAPVAACPGQTDLSASAATQEQAMNCLVDFARRRAGLSELLDTPALVQSAEDKSLDVLRCNEFSHFACGREFTYWMKETGYTSTPCWRVGENLAWGTGKQGAVRSIFAAWMRSPTHRANILGDYAESGLSLEVGSLEGQAGTRVWAEHFGTHCG